jgi:signal transduction histidine kinase/AraC-like DNA-binding protein
VEALCSQARVMISEAVDRSGTLRAWSTAQRDQQLRELGKRLLMTLDVRRLGDVLQESLPRLGIASAYLAVYSDSWDHPQLARLLVGFTEEGWVIDRDDPPVFPIGQVVPRRLRPRSRRHSLVVLPLFHQDQPLGYAALELGPLEGTVYEELRTYLSSALKGALLFDQARRAREEAERAGQLKSRLLANVSHELRTPLTAILRRVSDSLRRDRDGIEPMAHPLREDLYHIQANAERQLRVTDDLLDLSRAEIEQLHLAMSVIDPRPMLEREFRAMSSAPETRPGVRWEVDLPPRLPRLQADPDRLAQILRNLLDNAARCTRQGSIRLAAEVEPPYLHLSVRDTGVGLSRRQLERIFEPFAAAAETPGDSEADARRGIGLGLPVVRQLVALHAGGLQVESKPGRGATFHVRLPLPNLSGSPLSHPERTAAVLLVVSRAEKPAEEIRRVAERHGYALLGVHADTDWEADLGGRSPAALAWDMDQQSPGDWALIRSLRHHPLLFEAPFLLYGPPAGREGGTLFDLIDTACPAPSTGPMVILSADVGFREYFSRIVERGLEGFALRCLAGVEDALPLLLQQPPSLLILDLAIGAGSAAGAPELIRDLRRDERLQRVPVLLLGGEPLRPETVDALEGCAGVTLLHRGILTDSETLSLVSRLVFSPKLASPFPGALARRAAAYLSQSYHRPVTRWKLARAVNVSEDYLTRVFRRELGISPWTYLTRYRIQQARLLLARGETAIQAVAAQCGFRDQAYFCRVFRRLTGVPPLEYRKNALRLSV